MPKLSIHSLRSIAAIWPGLIPTELIQIVINAVRSKAVTQEEQALGHFTNRKLKEMSTWDDWEFGERK